MAAVPAMERFSEVFADEHRAVRDLLLELVRLFEAGDVEGARAALTELAVLAGPHFRYEEESLYPALVPIFGEEYVEKLLADHDGVIRGARRLLWLVNAASLDETETQEAVRLVRSILPHVSDCDGLTIMVEVLPSETVESILETRDAAVDQGLDLLGWARTHRSRAV